MLYLDRSVKVRNMFVELLCLWFKSMLYFIFNHLEN